jgi:hypothetical protein
MLTIHTSTPTDILHDQLPTTLTQNQLKAIQSSNTMYLLHDAMEEGRQHYYIITDTGINNQSSRMHLPGCILEKNNHGSSYVQEVLDESPMAWLMLGPKHKQ